MNARHADEAPGPRGSSLTFGRDMNRTFYTAFGVLTSAFARLEADIRFLIAGLAFSGESVAAAAFMDGSMLRGNLTILRRLGRQYWDAEDRITEIIDGTEKIRQLRNLFIHGLWSAKNFGVPDGFATVKDLRTTFEQDEHSRNWTHGSTEQFTLDDFQRTLAEVNAISAKIEELCGWFEKHEELDFGYFGGTSIGKPSRFSLDSDGSLVPIPDP